MTASEIIEKLNSRNITLTVQEGLLRYKAPKGAMTDELMSLLKNYKQELIRRIEQPPTVCYWCGGQTFWRKKEGIDGRWICQLCHPPALSKTGIELLQTMV